MPYGYLITVALVGVGTLCALAPPRRPRMLATVGFRVGVVVNELPLVVSLALLAATAFAIADDDVRSIGGWVMVAAATLTLAGLVLVIRRGVQAGATIERVLTDGLGGGWRAQIEPAMAVRLRRRLPLVRIVIWPFAGFVRPRAVERIANISYGEAGRWNLLDLYRHRSHPSGAPTLVYVHGGAYFSGHKSREARPLLDRLASQGWVCVSANYRLRPAATFPDHLIDLKKVIAWVREHGEQYGVDTSTMFVAGSSAGGHLAALAALTPNDPAFQPGFERADTSITGAITLYGYLGNYNGQGARSSPGAYVRADAPPFFDAQGELDTFSPRFVEVARGFIEELRSTSSNPVIYAELPGAQHAFDLFHSIRFEQVVDGIEAFAAWVISTRSQVRAEVDKG